MKYSLRSPIVVAVVMALVVASLAGRLALYMGPKRGSFEDMQTFLRVIKEPYSSNLHGATDKCFVVGAPASYYESVWAKADRSGVPDHYLPHTEQIPTGKQYEFWCEGKNPEQNGGAWVVVIVDGDCITHSWIGVWQPPLLSTRPKPANP